MYTATQQTGQWREQLLHATGGKLEVENCFYYLVIWHFNEEGIPKCLTTDNTRHVTIISGETGNPVTIDKKSPSESHNMPGTFTNPPGDYENE